MQRPYPLQLAHTSRAPNLNDPAPSTLPAIPMSVGGRSRIKACAKRCKYQKSGTTIPHLHPLKMMLLANGPKLCVAVAIVLVVQTSTFWSAMEAGSSSKRKAGLAAAQQLSKASSPIGCSTPRRCANGGLHGVRWDLA
eukprot:365712-Chlamydomonas_euryale.AAC.6